MSDPFNNVINFRDGWHCDLPEEEAMSDYIQGKRIVLGGEESWLSKAATEIARTIEHAYALKLNEGHPPVTYNEIMGIIAHYHERNK